MRRIMSFRTDIPPKRTVGYPRLKVNLTLAFSQWASGTETANENDQAIKMHTKQSKYDFSKTIFKSWNMYIKINKKVASGIGQLWLKRSVRHVALCEHWWLESSFIYSVFFHGWDILEMWINEDTELEHTHARKKKIWVLPSEDERVAFGYLVTERTGDLWDTLKAIKLSSSAYC